MGEKAKLLEGIAAQVRGHRACGHALCEGSDGLVPGVGSAYANAVFVGWAPGAAEQAAGRPFAGRAGRMLDRALAVAQLQPGDIYLTNVLKAPEPDGGATEEDVRHHAPWLLAELEVIRPLLVVPLGRRVLGRFAGDLHLGDVHGLPVEHNRWRLFVLPDPGEAVGDPARREALLADARELGLTVSRVLDAVRHAVLREPR